MNIVKSKVFGEANAYIDKYAGLVMDGQATVENLIAPWDHDPNDIEGRVILRNTEVWNGVIFLREEINDVLKPFQDKDKTIPKTFATRPGKPGKPKIKIRTRLIGIVRENGSEGFQLQRCDAGGQLIEVIQDLPLIDTCLITLEVNRSTNFVLFDPENEIHLRRLERLRS
jgi:hypothetical protein